MAETKECYSCGNEADPGSSRNFCSKCDKQFDDGLDRADKIVARAETLEAAKASGDSDKVGKIMTEIFKEAAVADAVAATQASAVMSAAPVSNATAKKEAE